MVTKVKVVRKSKLTDPARPYVVALDVTSSGISVARLMDGNPNVRAEWIAAIASAGKSHTVSSTMHRSQTLVRRVADLITDVRGDRVRPTLVVMVKPYWKVPAQDPSAGRRIGVWYLLAAELDRLGIPTAEVPIHTVSRWIGSGSRMSQDAFSDIAKKIDIYLSDVTPRAAVPSLDERTVGQYRQTTVAVVAAAAMVAGIETGVPVTQERLNILGGYSDEHAREKSDGGVVFPHGRKPPRTVDIWKMRNSDPSPWLDKRNSDTTDASA